MNLPEPSLEVSDTVREDEVAVLQQGLVAYNQPFLGELDHRRLGLMLRVEGRIVGGLVADTARGLLAIDMLWLAPGYRGRGLGSRLLQAAEREARARGCLVAWLDTFDFQARPFYERHGYTVFGELDGLPNGHRRWFMRKRLDG